jgi:putative FmdB family regulatory protein
MPIYEYRCRACGQEFETIQRVGSRSRRKCPACSGRLEKLVSRTAFQLEGGGWFEQGYSDPARPQDPGKNNEERAPN